MSSDARLDVPSEVRVHVRLGTMRLDYHGARAFYERNVESLVASASHRRGGDVAAAAAAARGGRLSHSVGPSDGPATPTPSDGAEASGTSSAEALTADPREPAAKAYEPASPEFGRYVRRLGPDADAPDRHVVAFAFYLWNYERMETFGFNEIEGCLHAIGRTLPDDAPAVFADLTENKRFLESAGERRWRLAKKGENYVKSRLLTL